MKTWSPGAIDQVLDESSKIFVVLSEQQVRRRRAAKGMSKCFGEVSQYRVFLDERRHVGDMRNRVLIDGLGVFSIEGVMRSSSKRVPYEKNKKKVIHNKHIVAYTLMTGDFMPETPQSPNIRSEAYGVVRNERVVDFVRSE